MQINRIDHLAIAVESIDAALPFFTEALGLEVTHTDVEEEQGVVVAFMPIGGSQLELIEPVDAESGVGRFLARRGAGMHHLCLEVEDMDAALERLRAHDVRLIDEEPYIGTGGRRIVFIHPKAAQGVLVELYERLPGDSDRSRLPRLLSLDELRQNLAEMRQNLSELSRNFGERGEELAERRRRLMDRGRVAAAGTRGFLESLRRGGNGEDGVESRDGADAVEGRGG